MYRLPSQWNVWQKNTSWQLCLICVSRAELKSHLHTVQTQIIEGYSYIPSAEGGQPIIFPLQEQVSTSTHVPRETWKSRKWLNKQLCTFYCLNRIPIRATWRKIIFFPLESLLHQTSSVKKYNLKLPLSHRSIFAQLSTLISPKEDSRLSGKSMT